MNGVFLHGPVAVYLVYYTVKEQHSTRHGRAQREHIIPQYRTTCAAATFTNAAVLLLS